MRSDPGVGSWDAAEDSLEWAQRFRLAWITTKHDLRSAPERFAKYLRKALDMRAWTKMNGEDGKPFATFEAFCLAPEPWGFGEPWEKIKPYLAGVMSERELEVATERDAKPATPGPGRGHKKPVKTSLTAFREARSESAASAQVRAIERAPAPARDLYVAGLLGQKEAAKLGPKAKDKDPTVAARVTEIAIELAADAKKLDASTDALKEQAKRALNVKARELLGIRRDRIAEALRAIEKLNDEERGRLIQAMSERGWLQ